MKKQAEEWMKFAENDLLAAKELIENNELTQIVAFHAQQSIEKSLKAILELQDKKIPRIHDLRKLLHIVNNLKFEITYDDEMLDQLNQVYIDSRYPADSGLMPDGIPSVNKATEFITLSENIFNQVIKTINNNQ